MDLTLTRDTLYLRPYPRHRKAMLSVASHPVYKVLDSVTPLGDQAVLPHLLLVSTTNQPITVTTTVLFVNVLHLYRCSNTRGHPIYNYY